MFVTPQSLKFILWHRRMCRRYLRRKGVYTQTLAYVLSNEFIIYGIREFRIHDDGNIWAFSIFTETLLLYGKAF